MKNKNRIIGLVITIILIVLLVNPQWLPFSTETKEAMRQILNNNFNLSNSAGVNLAKILMVILAVCILWLITGVINLILSTVKVKNSHGKTLVSLILSVVKYAGVLIGFIWALSILGVNVAAILAGLGIIGLIIGFGAQSLIEDIITGIFIIFEGHYNIGDVIVLGDFRGVVRDITVRTTVIEDVGGNLKVVNNSDIRNFQNRSKKNSLAISLISVSYDTDLRELEKIIAKEMPEMYKNNKDLYLSAPVYLGVHDVADSGVVLKFQVEVNELNIFVAQRQLNRDLKLMMDDNNIEIPFTQVVVHNGK